MGIDISVVGKWRSGARTPSRADAFARITKAIDSLVTDPLARRMLHFHEHEHCLHVTVHALGEPIDFMWEPGTRIAAGAKTSTVGPGFHAWVVDLLNKVGAAAGLEWDWSEDEAAFSRDGDFAALQRSMAGLLRALAGAFLDAAHGLGGVACNMPIGLYPQEEPIAFSYTPLGPRDRAWWEAARRGEELETLCREFYPWWDREQDAAYWRKVGLGVMWVDVPWHPPDDEDEDNTCRLALEAMERAATLDPSMPLPVDDIAELAAMLDGEDEDDAERPPRPGGVGYRRGLTRRVAPGGWSLLVPGYYYEDWHEDEGVLVFGFADRAVHISTYTVRPDGRAIPAPTLVEDFQFEGEPGSEVFTYVDGAVRGRAMIGPLEEDDSEPGFALQGCMASDGEVAVITVAFADEADGQWALDTWKSLAHFGDGGSEADA
jgi:hypothetical protein